MNVVLDATSCSPVSFGWCWNREIGAADANIAFAIDRIRDTAIEDSRALLLPLATALAIGHIALQEPSRCFFFDGGVFKHGQSINPNIVRKLRKPPPPDRIGHVQAAERLTQLQPDVVFFHLVCRHRPCSWGCAGSPGVGISTRSAVRALANGISFTKCHFRCSPSPCKSPQTNAALIPIPCSFFRKSPRFVALIWKRRIS